MGYQGIDFYLEVLRSLFSRRELNLYSMLLFETVNDIAGPFISYTFRFCSTNDIFCKVSTIESLAARMSCYPAASISLFKNIDLFILCLPPYWEGVCSPFGLSRYEMDV